MEEFTIMEYYVLLTGGKNNAGDFLIKHRAKKLLSELRPDREFVDLNAWELFDQEKLEMVNNSKALLLTGGPALSRRMYGGVYKLTENLNDIKVPIITFGLGWYAPRGELHDVHDYMFNARTKELLNRISNSGYYSSVRDYHTLHAIKKEGLDDVYMTGCPALYDIESMNKEIRKNTPEKILFSLGVNHARSNSMDKSVKQLLLLLKDRFENQEFKVMFHHSIDPEYLNTPDPSVKLYHKHVAFAKWLKDKQIPYQDISGGAEELINEYSSADFHIGYRVHAHIFMSSISKPSILIAEDGRGKALKKVLGGEIFDGFINRKNSLLVRGLEKLNIYPFDPYEVDSKLDQLVLDTTNYEIENDLPRLRSVRKNINNHYDIMTKFMRQLP